MVLLTSCIRPRCRYPLCANATRRRQRWVVVGAPRKEDNGSASGGCNWSIAPLRTYARRKTLATMSFSHDRALDDAGYPWEALPRSRCLVLTRLPQEGYRDYVVIITARLSSGRLMVLAALPVGPRRAGHVVDQYPSATPWPDPGPCAPICGTPTSRPYVRSCLMPRS